MTNENQKGSTLLAEQATDEMVESSASVADKGLQQHFSPSSVAELVRNLSHNCNVLDLTAGDGSLLQYVTQDRRFGVEIDGDQIANATTDGRGYTAIQGDLQQVAHLMFPLDWDFGFAALNPPYGLDWEDETITAALGEHNLSEVAKDGKVSSTFATWWYAHQLLCYNGSGLIVLGKNRYEREIKPTLSSVNLYGDYKPWVFAEINVPDLWPDVGIDVMIVCFAKVRSYKWTDPGAVTPEPLRLTVEGPDLGSQELSERLQTFCAQQANVDTYSYSQRPYERKFEAVQQEYDITTAARRMRARRNFDLYAVGGKLRWQPKPYTQMRMRNENGSILNQLTALHKSELTYFAMNPKVWHEIVESWEAGQFRADPKTMARVEEIIETNHKKVVPLYELKPQQRLAYLKDLSTIECIQTTPDGQFIQGEHYSVVVQTQVHESFERQRPVTNKRTGEVQLKDYVQRRKLLSIRIGPKRMSEVKEDIEFIVEHFDVPNPGTVVERYPDDYQRNRDVLTKLEEGRNWTFRDFQKEDLARLLVKDDGLLAWEQGLGKTLAGLTFIEAHHVINGTRSGLIVAPQDLIPQWIREAKRFYGRELVWLRSYHDFRKCRDDVAAGGTDIYITHYEALSRTGKQKGEMLPLDTKVRYRLREEKEQKVWEEDAGDGQPGYKTIPAKQHLDPILATQECPECSATYRQGYNPERRFCSNCRGMWVNGRVKPLYAVIKNTFRHGVLVIDELTMIKGDSDRSEAIRGLKANYVLGMTGTPVKNYIPDAFWGLWKCLGNATPRFPYAYNGGKTQFENDFAVTEFETTGYKRRGRKVLPEVTNLSALWRMLSSAIVRRRKEETSEALVPRTFYEVTAPWGEQQKKQYKTWLYRFGEFFANENPDSPVVKAGAQDRLAAMLGQLHKLEFATTMPEADYDRDYWDVPVSNWTPKNAKVLEIVAYHAKRGEKVLVGSAVKKSAVFLTEQLNRIITPEGDLEDPKKHKVVNILDKDGETKSPAQRATVVKKFQDGNALVLCASVQAMSLGHNLDAANVVVLTGLPWDFASLDQFIARVHRLTSKKDVRVYICLTEGSIDERKWELLVKKGAAASLALDGRLIEEDEQKIDQTAFLKELQDAGVSIDNDAVPESEIEAIWANKKLADIGELNLEPSGDIEGLADALPDEPDPEPEAEPEPEPEPEEKGKGYFIASGNASIEQIKAYLYEGAVPTDWRDYEHSGRALVEIKCDLTMYAIVRERLASGLYQSTAWFEELDEDEYPEGYLDKWGEMVQAEEERNATAIRHAEDQEAERQARLESQDEVSGNTEVPAETEEPDSPSDPEPEVAENVPEPVQIPQPEPVPDLTDVVMNTPIPITVPATPQPISDDFEFGF